MEGYGVPSEAAKYKLAKIKLFSHKKYQCPLGIVSEWNVHKTVKAVIFNALVIMVVLVLITCTVITFVGRHPVLHAWSTWFDAAIQN